MPTWAIYAIYLQRHILPVKLTTFAGFIVKSFVELSGITKE